MNRPQENDFPCKNQSFKDGNEYYLIKNMRYMVALSDYMDDLENRIEVLEKALDKACERLADDYISSSKEWWKKEFLGEVQDE